MVQQIFDPDTINYDLFFTEFNKNQQFGAGDANYGVFTGRPFMRGFGRSAQHGAGFVDTLRTLWQYLIPVAKSAGKVIGREGLHVGPRILSDLAQGKPATETLSKETRSGAANLAEHAVKSLRGGGRARAGIRLTKRHRGRSVNSNVAIKRRGDIFT